MKNLIFIAAFMFGLQATAQDLVSTFKSLNSNRKGPFSLNYLQGSQGRVVVNQGTPTGEFQFQAAFRNEIGRALAIKFDFYTANLFTTNYYELQGEFVYNDIYGSHPIDHAALVASGSRAMPKAASMARHWVLEKHYLAHFPNSAIAKGFNLRGISDLENERTYAPYFFNFYLGAMEQDFQFLPVFLLAQGSPITASASLEKARTLIAQIYDHYEKWYNANSPSLQRLYQLRNQIHNQLSESVIDAISTFLRDFPEYQNERGLYEVQNIIREYYNVTPQKVADLARAAGASQIQTIAAQIARQGGGTASFLSLSRAVAALRGDLTAGHVIPWEKRTASLVLIASASQFLNKEILRISRVNSKDTVETIVNLVYAEGFLIQDNWQYFIGDVQSASDAVAAGALLPDIVGIANDTLDQAFSPSLKQWITVEPKMNYFIDNTIKSSSLNTASIIAGRVRR